MKMHYLCGASGDQLLQNSPRAEMQQGYVVERCARRFCLQDGYLVFSGASIFFNLSIFYVILY